MEKLDTQVHKTQKLGGSIKSRCTKMWADGDLYNFELSGTIAIFHGFKFFFFLNWKKANNFYLLFISFCFILIDSHSLPCWFHFYLPLPGNTFRCPLQGPHRDSFNFKFEGKISHIKKVFRISKTPFTTSLLGSAELFIVTLG